MAGPRFHLLCCDIGGVLGTNGWDTQLRDKVAAHFGVDPKEIQGRHRLMFDSFERGYLTFDDYLRYVFFASARDFTLEQVRDFTYSQSMPWHDSIEFFARLKRANQLKIALISNEGQGITQYRVRKFGLRELADFLVISHFVHFRKPDREIWRLALDLAQAIPEESIYIDDREIFAGIAAEMGFTSLHHISLDTTKQKLGDLGLVVT